MSCLTDCLKTVRTTDAVGAILCHDITRIIPGKEKGPVFRKGHVVTEADIPVLLSVGKENLYVLEPRAGVLHENEAALRIARAVAGKYLCLGEAKEGRINFTAACQGLLQVDVDTLTKINSLGDISLATLHTLQTVSAGQAVAGTRITPLVIEEQQIERLERLVTRPVLEVHPFNSLSVGIVTTGSEIFSGRIQDGFGPVLVKKFSEYGCTIRNQLFSDDSVEMTATAIRTLLDQRVDMVVCTGGMSVDPDDRTPAAIRAVADTVVSYGAPTFPGAMFMLAFVGRGETEIPILGLPGCVMYNKASIFDLVLPRLLAGQPVQAADIAALGHGGFCSSCAECRFPVCAFGKF